MRWFFIIPGLEQMFKMLIVLSDKCLTANNTGIFKKALTISKKFKNMKPRSGRACPGQKRNRKKLQYPVFIVYLSKQKKY